MQSSTVPAEHQRELAELALKALRSFPEYLEGLGPNVLVGDVSMGYADPVVLYLSDKTPYKWVASNMTLCTTDVDVVEDPENVVLGSVGPGEWWSVEEAPEGCDMAQIPWLRSVLQYFSEQFEQQPCEPIYSWEMLALIKKAEAELRSSRGVAGRTQSSIEGWWLREGRSLN